MGISDEGIPLQLRPSHSVCTYTFKLGWRGGLTNMIFTDKNAKNLKLTASEKLTGVKH